MIFNHTIIAEHGTCDLDIVADRAILSKHHRPMEIFRERLDVASFANER